MTTNIHGNFGYNKFISYAFLSYNFYAVKSMKRTQNIENSIY